MRRWACIGITLGVILCLMQISFAQTQEEAKKAYLKGLELKARQTLTSQEWTVYVVPLEITKKETPKMETDVLSFTDTKVRSQNLSQRGYAESNYSLRIQDDGTAVWETMQVNENGDLAFLRGDLKGNEMTGIISMQPQKGSRRDYSFFTTMPQIIAPTVVEEKPKKRR
ncbi:MAG: hypothetical protein NC826_06900 [Candidatus Omnitrophica bacterium]|nr:hypothetical protein [Candidatus Omnitrophota bacterium]